MQQFQLLTGIFRPGSRGRPAAVLRLLPTTISGPGRRRVTGNSNTDSAVSGAWGAGRVLRAHTDEHNAAGQVEGKGRGIDGGAAPLLCPAYLEQSLRRVYRRAGKQAGCQNGHQRIACSEAPVLQIHERRFCKCRGPAMFRPLAAGA